MILRGLVALIARFIAGWAGALLFGGMVFKGAVLLPGNPAFRCMIIGALCAGIFAGARSRNKRHALAVIAGYGAWQFVLAREAGLQLQLVSTASQLALGVGIFLVALIYDALACEGWRVGKFLVAGPALAGVYLALSPLKYFGGLPHGPMAVDIALAFLIGNGVAFGLEMVELYPGLSQVPGDPPAAVLDGPGLDGSSPNESSPNEPVLDGSGLDRSGLDEPSLDRSGE